ncbi:MAG: DUF3137 domain-containing protein [Spirochaetota bacterium]
MKSVQELEKFYNTDLENNLNTLENERKGLVKKLIPIIIIGILALGGALLIFFSTQTIILSIIIGIIVIGGGIYLSTNMISKYKNKFKKEIIDKIVKFIDPVLEYNPEDYITKSEYMNSELFKKNPDRYKGEDYVAGKIGETPIRFSEVHSEYYTTDNKGNRHYHTIFKGLFFIADFNKRFKGKTFVLPDVAQSTFGDVLGHFFQSWNKGRGELVKLEDSEFEEIFVVYADDQVEARYILSTSLMERIKKYKQRTGKKIFISFVDNNIYVAISYNKNLFEPKIFSTITDFNHIKEYYDDLMLAVSLVEDLNLNLRIWADE